MTDENNTDSLHVTTTPRPVSRPWADTMQTHVGRDDDNGWTTDRTYGGGICIDDATVSIDEDVYSDADDNVLRAETTLSVNYDEDINPMIAPSVAAATTLLAACWQFDRPLPSDETVRLFAATIAGQARDLLGITNEKGTIDD